MKNIFHQFRVVKEKHSAGFSTIELFVSIAIFALLTSFVIVNHRSVGNRTNVDSIAHEIALWIRDAQVSSMGVRLTAAGNDNFTSGYGVHFDTTNRTRFIFFADRDRNGIFSLAAGDTAEQTINLLRGYTVTAICGGHSGTGAMNCGGAAGLGATTFLDISFKRPNPDASIRGQTIGGADTFSPARVIVTSPRGLTRMVVVYATGQVSVQ